MIYCIGERARYDAKLAAGVPLYKGGRGIRKATYNEGGSVWQTEDDARAFIFKNKLEDSRAVYGVLADWETDTLQVRGEPFRRLLKTSRIVPLTGARDKGFSEAPSDSNEAGPERGVGR